VLVVYYWGVCEAACLLARFVCRLGEWEGTATYEVAEPT